MLTRAADGCPPTRQDANRQPRTPDSDGVRVAPPVYIDPLMTCLVSAAWKWPKSCHMFVGPETDIEVLHQFAARIGMKRAWFQHKPGKKMPHYDLNERRRKAAVANGAIALDRAAAVQVIRRWRAIEEARAQ